MIRRVRKAPEITTQETVPADTGELGETLSQVSKRYGESSVRKACNIYQPDRIPFGVFTLDYALLGGAPNNRTVTIVGERSSGKSSLASKLIANAQKRYPDQTPVVIDVEGCVFADTVIVDSDTGEVYTAQELYSLRKPIRVMSRDSQNGLVPSRVVGWYDNGVKPLVEIRAGSSSIKTTLNHKFLVVDDTDTFSWVRADNLRPGMLVCRPRDMQISWASTSVLSDEVCEFVGMMIGDGSYSARSMTPVFTHKTENEVLDRFLFLFDTFLGTRAVKYDDRHYRLSRRWDGVWLSGEPSYNEVHELFKYLGILGQASHNKTIPVRIIRGTLSGVIGVLSGLYNTDGTASTCRATLSYSTTSTKLVHQIQYLWTRLGVVSTVHKYVDGHPKHRDYYAVNINGKEALTRAASYLRLVGRRGQILQEWCRTESRKSGRNPADKYMPSYYTRSTRHRSEEKEQRTNRTGMYFVKVDTISLAGEGRVYDFTVEHTHNYVANGLVVHNSFESVWASKLGVDPSGLPVVDCETGEMAIDIADAVVGSEETSLVVVDSIAALVPMKEQASSVTGDSMVLVRNADTNEILYLPIRSVYESFSGNLETMAYKDGHFMWRRVVNVWKPAYNPNHRLLEVRTQYGRHVRLTDCHSVYRVSLDNRRKDADRGVYVQDGTPELVRGGDLRVGDYLLSYVPDGRLASAENCTVSMYEYQDATCNVAHIETLRVSMRDHRAYGRRYLYASGPHGPRIPLHWLQEPPNPDSILYYRRPDSWTKAEIPARAIGYLIGAYLGNGYVHGNTVKIYAGCTVHTAIQERLAMELGAYTHPISEAEPLQDRVDYLIRVGGPIGRAFACWFDGQQAVNKEIPAFVYSWSIDEKRAVLDGLIDTDGSVYRDQRVTISTSSFLLAEGVSLLLSDIGVVASTSMRQPSQSILPCGRIIQGRHVNYLVSFSKSAYFGDNEGQKGRRVPSILVSDGMPVRILGIKEIPLEDVYDMEVEDAATFTANRLLVHNSAEDQFMGLQARLIGTFIRRITSSLIKERKRGHFVTLLLLNQYRMKVGFVMGDPRTEPGGKAIEFAASVQIALKNKELSGKDEYGCDTITDNEHAFTIKKNKLNGGPRTGEYVMVRTDKPDQNLFAGDVDDSPILLSFAKRLGLYSGGGKKWTLAFDDYSLSFAKADEAIAALRTDPVLFWALRTYLIRDNAAKLGMPTEFIERIV